MRIGIVLGESGGYGDAIPALEAEYRQAVAVGFSSVWMTQHLGFDVLTLMASWGPGGPELGTAVVPVQTRHPVTLAEQALTTQSLTGGRLTLGLGLAHAATLEAVYGLPGHRSVSYFADYLSALQALMAGQKTAPTDSFSMKARLGVELPEPPPVLLAALGPRMLELAGSRAAGTITWMTGAATLGNYIAPTICAAAEAAGRSEPRIVACLPMCITADVSDARQRIGSAMAAYGTVPSYRAMLDREGVVDAVDIAIIGNQQHVQETVASLLDGGASDVVVIPVGTPDERDITRATLGDMALSTG